MKPIAIILTLLMLTSCTSGIVRSEKITSTPIDCGAVPKWDVIVLDQVTPFSIKNAAGDPGVHFSPEEYKTMANNWQNVKKFVRQSNSVVTFYKDCIEKYNTRIEEQNKKPPVVEESKKGFFTKLKFWE